MDEHQSTAAERDEVVVPTTWMNIAVVALCLSFVAVSMAFAAIFILLTCGYPG